MRVGVRRRLAAVIVAVVSVPLLLGGCDAGADPEPEFSESPSAESSPSESGSASESAEPEQESAEEFIRRWNRASTRMQITGETADYRALTFGCRPCDELASTVEDFYAAGGSIRTAPTRATKIEKVGKGSGIHAFHLVLRTPPSRYRETADGPVKRLAGGPAPIEVQLRLVDNSWRIIDYTRRPG